MTLTTLIIDSILLLAIVCVSLYGTTVLPPEAEVPVHFGPDGYNRWVRRNTGLFMWPAIAAVVYAILGITVRAQQADGGSGPPIGLSIALGVMLINQIGALRAAINRYGRN